MIFYTSTQFHYCKIKYITFIQVPFPCCRSQYFSFSFFFYHAGPMALLYRAVSSFHAFYAEPHMGDSVQQYCISTNTQYFSY